MKSSTDTIPKLLLSLLLYYTTSQPVSSTFETIFLRFFRVINAFSMQKNNFSKIYIIYNQNLQFILIVHRNVLTYLYKYDTYFLIVL